MTEFITPNWHPLLVHYPIALLTLGLALELAGALFRRSGLTTAARWSIGVGAFSAIPAAILGAYAFRDVVTTGPISLHRHWHEVVERSHWSEAAFEAIRWHVWLNGAATVVAVAAAVVWIAASPAARARLRWLLVLVVAVAVGLNAAGSWFGGELVYRHGAGVVPEPGAGAGAATLPRELRAYVQPLQLHALLAGVTIALGVLGLALTLRLWRRTAAAREEPAAAPEPAVHPDPTEPAEPDRRRARALRLPAGHVRGTWALVSLGVLGAALAGLWSVLGALDQARLEAFFREVREPAQRRLLAHLVVGVAILVVPLLPLAAPRALARRRALSGAFAGLLVVLVGGQIYLGSIMLFDGHEGPLVGFARPAAAPAEEEEDEPAEHANGEVEHGEVELEEEGAAEGGAEAAEPAGEAPAADEPALVVVMTDELTYEPERATIRAGDTVLWTNPSAMMHTVTADPEVNSKPEFFQLPEGAEPFDSGDIDPGEEYRHTFTVPGLYRYYCIPHDLAGMVGELEVEPADGEER